MKWRLTGDLQRFVQVFYADSRLNDSEVCFLSFLPEYHPDNLEASTCWLRLSGFSILSISQWKVFDSEVFKNNFYLSSDSAVNWPLMLLKSESRPSTGSSPCQTESLANRIISSYRIFPQKGWKRVNLTLCKLAKKVVLKMCARICFVRVWNQVNLISIFDSHVTLCDLLSAFKVLLAIFSINIGLRFQQRWTLRTFGINKFFFFRSFLNFACFFEML